MLAWSGICTTFYDREGMSMFIVREKETSNEGVVQGNGDNKWNKGPEKVIRGGIKNARRGLILVQVGMVTSSSEPPVKEK